MLCFPFSIYETVDSSAVYNKLDDTLNKRFPKDTSTNLVALCVSIH